MYKCSECGTEYEIKPEYCDCGNDLFEEVVEPQKADPDIKAEQKIVIKPAPKEELKVNKPEYSGPKQTQKSTYDYSGVKSFFDPLSTIIFLCLIALSMYVTWIGYDPEFYAKRAEQAKAQKQEVKLNIPEIDSFWDNTPISKSVQLPQAEPVETEQKIVQFVEQVFKPQQKPQVTAQTPKVQTKLQTTTKQTTTPKTQTATKPAAAQTTKTITQTQKTQTQTQTPKTTTTNKTNTSTPTSSTQNNSGIDLNSIINNNKKYSNNSQQATSSTTTTTTTNATKVSSSTASQMSTSVNTTAPAIRTSTNTSQSNSTKTSSSSTATTTPEQTVDPAVAKQELANYKIGLRNTIGKKIDFTRVVGDGECSLSFKISSSGQLTNRAFTKQSTNITSNDAAYAAINATTRYNVPPSAYKGETLNLNIRFYNGNFNISLN